MYYIRKEGIKPREIITITDFCNMDNNYKPRVDFNVTYNKKGFHVHFLIYEKNPIATYKNNFDPVCKDSCVEWFIYFAPDICNRYFNFEVNANGAMDVSFRVSRDDYIEVMDADVNTFNINTEINNDFWTVDYIIPFDFIKKYISGYEFKTDVSLKANVYKCCEVPEIKHYGCWGMVDRNEPDFHKPEFFKTMKII